MKCEDCLGFGKDIDVSVGSVINTEKKIQWDNIFPSQYSIKFHQVYDQNNLDSPCGKKGTVLVWHFILLFKNWEEIFIF